MASGNATHHYTCYLVFFSIIFSLETISVKAQTKNPYTYHDLSESVYEKQKDSIRKNWACPVEYNEKTTQKQYKEIWDGRVHFIYNAISNNHYVHEKEIYTYVDQVISEIALANRTLIPAKPILFIDRSSSVNAYAIGGNIIAVNLGLLSFVQYREELAMVIAHELSHNILNHADKSMKERAEWLTSDDYKKSLNAVLNSKYERFTKLKKVFEGYSFDRSKHSRYHESDADSLALVLLKAARISYSPEFFLRLDSADNQYKLPLKNSIKNYFTAYNLAFEDTWTQKRSKGLSTRTYNFKDTSGMEDSLKTHPDCIDRYRKAVKFSSAQNKFTPFAPALREKATKMLIWNMFDKQSLTACLYRVLQEKDKGNRDEWYDFMLSNVFSALFYADKQLSRFNAIGIVPKEIISKDYYELQSLLEQIPRESLEKYCRDINNLAFWQNMPPDAKALKSFLNTLNFNEEPSAKLKETAVRDFLINNSNSMFNEFVSHFKK